MYAPTRFLIGCILCSILFSCTDTQETPLPPATDPATSTTRPADPNALVVVPEDSIARFLKYDLVEDLPAMAAKDRRFLYEAADLNADGKPEYFVTFKNPYFCGSGGCNLLILNNDFSLLSRHTVVRVPLYLGEETEAGMRDLLVFSNLQYCTANPHRLRFGTDGYPPNPSVVPCTEEDLTGLTALFDLDRTGVEEYEF